ncbi:hypothetical protein F383_35322 [Gossypium arboreum]|uniref:Uncharacterized protein n=1 Tax=Gossypium arboreum TaxID=29729 RepID=A0A0B0N5Z2_GOSAR|nr:hypothetical protein F383_35322 [Gossypium arboreum]
MILVITSKHAVPNLTVEEARPGFKGFGKDGRTEEMTPGDMEAEREGLSCKADPLVYSRIF